MSSIQKGFDDLRIYGDYEEEDTEEFYGPMKLNEYQDRALETAVYPKDNELSGIVYTSLGLVGEAGELANKLKKVLRGDVPYDFPMQQELASELGDCLWYIAAIASELGHPLENIALDNLLKLESRKRKGNIKGSGDNR